MFNVLQVIKEMSGGGVDCSFECIGVPSVMAEAFRSTKKVRRRQTDYTSMLR
jgi:S-(hydroxymethyl)glutathione dehydrogenase/alcohol dehydrogenase